MSIVVVSLDLSSVPQLPPFSFSPTAAGTADQSSASRSTPLADQESAQSSRPKRRGRPPSIGIRLGQDGKADTSSMSADQLAKIRSAVAGTSILTADERKLLAEERQAKIDAVKPICIPLLKLLGGIEASLAKRSHQCTLQQAAIFHYTEAEVRMLQEPTAAVIAKHAHGLEKWSEEVTLVGYLVMIHQQKSAQLRSMLATEKSTKAEATKKAAEQGSISSLEQEQIPVQVNGGAQPRKS